MQKSEYQLQAEKFLTDTGTTLTRYFTGTRPHFEGEKDSRDIYSITLTRGAKSYTFDYGDSIDNTRKHRHGERYTQPNAYDILACLTKYEPADNIDDFASEYGYEKIGETIRVYEAVKKEWSGVSSLFNEEELEIMREIQ